MMLAPTMVLAEMEAATIEVRNIQDHIECVLAEPTTEQTYGEDDYFRTS